MKPLTSLVVILATLLSALGHGQSFAWTGTLIAVFAGLLWLFGQWRETRWAAPLGIILFTLMAAFGLGLAPPLASLLLIASGVSALAAWDLNHFSRRLEYASEGEKPGLQRAHLKRLLTVGLTGFLLAGVAATLRVNLTLAGAVALGALVILGLNRAAGMMRRQ